MKNRHEQFSRKITIFDQNLINAIPLDVFSINAHNIVKMYCFATFRVIPFLSYERQGFS